MSFVKFQTPLTMILSGCTSSGKTTFVKKLIENSNGMFSQKPDVVYYFYGCYQPVFESIKGVKFIQGLPNSFEPYFDTSLHVFAIIDDLQAEAASSKAVESLFTRDSHHKNFSVCILNQNLFYQGKFCRTIALNCHVYILFKNPRSNSQIKILQSQTGIYGLVDFYNDALKEPFGYLVVDLSPLSEPEYKVRTKIFPGEYTIVYK